jgi:hypothetical protein
VFMIYVNDDECIILYTCTKSMCNILSICHHSVSSLMLMRQYNNNSVYKHVKASMIFNVNKYPCKNSPFKYGKISTLNLTLNDDKLIIYYTSILYMYTILYTHHHLYSYLYSYIYFLTYYRLSKNFNRPMRFTPIDIIMNTIIITCVCIQHVQLKRNVY